MIKKFIYGLLIAHSVSLYSSQAVFKQTAKEVKIQVNAIRTIRHQLAILGFTSSQIDRYISSVITNMALNEKLNTELENESK